jgi:murein tripeptide amidase MpaA
MASLEKKQTMPLHLPQPRFDLFYRHDALTELLMDYADAAPELVSVASIGQSHEGRDIWLATLTNTATGPADDKPAFWIDGNIHAAELTASTACLYYLHQLLKGFGSDRAITELLNRLHLPALESRWRRARAGRPPAPHPLLGAALPV